MATKKHSKSAIKKACARASMPSDAALAKVCSRARRAPALLSSEERAEAERVASERDWVRLATWSVLSMPGKDIIKAVRDKRDTAVAFAALSDAAVAYRKNLKQIEEFVETMEVQIMVALAHREDMAGVIEEARKSEWNEMTKDQLLAHASVSTITGGAR
jgi:hypothetical protein